MKQALQNKILLPKKSGDLYDIENVDHKVEDLYFFAFVKRKQERHFHCN
jgi:hypothetical protein